VTETETPSTVQSTKKQKSKEKRKHQQAMVTIELQHCDIIKDEFWAQRRWLLEEEC
jgi:hypothetical protein